LEARPALLFKECVDGRSRHFGFDDGYQCDPRRVSFVASMMQTLISIGDQIMLAMSIGVVITVIGIGFW
jgi:hypothetical protein